MAQPAEPAFNTLPLSRPSFWKTALRSRWVLALRAAITLVLIAYVLWRAGDGLREIRLRIVDPVQLGIALAGASLAMLTSARLWHTLIPIEGRPPFPRILASYLNGLVWNNFLPTSMGGDVVRTLELSSHAGRTDLAVGSVLMSRLASLWGVVLLATGSAAYLMVKVGWSAMGLVAAIPVVALLGTFVISAALLGTTVPGILPHRWRAHLRRYAHLRAFYHRPACMLRALGWGLTIQLLAVAINVLVAGALGLPIGPAQLCFGMPLINLVLLLPVSIGGFGLREGAYIHLLGLMGVQAADAVLLGIVVHGLISCVAALGAAAAALIGRRKPGVR